MEVDSMKTKMVASQRALQVWEEGSRRRGVRREREEGRGRRRVGGGRGRRGVGGGSGRRRVGGGEWRRRVGGGEWEEGS